MEECNHKQEIAKELYLSYRSHQTRKATFEALSEQQQAGWNQVAEDALVIIGTHAVKDIKNYLADQGQITTGWKKALYYIGVALAGAALTAGTSLLTGCTGSMGITLESQYGKLTWGFDQNNNTVVIPQKK